MRRISALLIIILAVAAPTLASPADDMKEADALRAEGKFAAANLVYGEVLDAQPKNADAMVGRAFCLLATGDAEEAADLFREVLVLHPGYVDAALGLARIYKQNDDLPDAERILRNNRAAVEQDPALLEYLLREAWKMGFVEFARDLDMRHPAMEKRTPINRANTVTAEVLYSVLEGGDAWTAAGGTYLRYLRPDVGISLTGHGYRRPYGTEAVGGFGVFYKMKNRLTLVLDMAFGDPGAFMPRQRYRPMLKLSLAPGNLMGLGADIAAYNRGALRLGVLMMQQQFGTVTVRLTGRGGVDPAEEPVTAVMMTVERRTESGAGWKAGAAYGNETDEGALVTVPGTQVSSLFAGVTVPFAPWAGCAFTLTGEWRDRAYFRTELGAAPYVRF